MTNSFIIAANKDSKVTENNRNTFLVETISPNCQWLASCWKGELYFWQFHKMKTKQVEGNKENSVKKTTTVSMSFLDPSILLCERTKEGNDIGTHPQRSSDHHPLSSQEMSDNTIILKLLMIGNVWKVLTYNCFQEE